jgi:hypothetical protein
LSFAPPTCRMPLGQASGFSRADPGGRGTPRFRHRLIGFRHFIDGSLALASLNLACRDQVPTFPQRSPPSLLTTAACGGLRPAPDCRPRRALLHLSYSSAPSYSHGAFVTHAPQPTFEAAETRDRLRLPFPPSHQSAGPCHIQRSEGLVSGRQLHQTWMTFSRRVFDRPAGRSAESVPLRIMSTKTGQRGRTGRRNRRARDTSPRRYE